MTSNNMISYKFKTSFLLIIVGMMTVFSFINCKSPNPMEPKDLGLQKELVVVKRQTAYLGWNQSVTMDIPIVVDSGKTGLVQDSIISFLYREIHNEMNSLCTDTILHDEANDDWDYMSASFFNLEDALRNTYEDRIEDTGGHWITFALLAQTESFVTYGFEHYHCGGSCGSEFYCYTFSKKDGHRIKNIIAWDDIQRFIKDHPKAKHPYGQWQLKADDDFMNEVPLYDVALLNDGLLMVNEDEVNHYKVGKIAYEDVLPYLSQEVQELVRAMGDGIGYSREDWYLGRCIGEIYIKGDGPILLMQREPLWLSMSDFNSTDEETFCDDKVYNLTAYEEIDGTYKPIKIFDLKAEHGSASQREWAESVRKTKLNGDRYCSRLEFEFLDGACNESTIEDEYFVLSGKVLYVPYKNDVNVVDFVPFMFDDDYFVIIDSEKTKPEELVVGQMVSDKNESICLLEAMDIEGFHTNIPGINLVAYGVAAYYVRGGLYIPARIFPYYNSIVKYLPGDEPLVTSCPNGGFYAFDSKERKIYTAISERTSMGGYGYFDRYDVYGYNGVRFIYEGVDGGFWLHPSIRKFGRLFYLGKSKDYLVRIDEMRSYDWRGLNEEDYEAEKKDTHRYRYAAWKHKDNMTDAPDVVIENGFFDSNKGCYVFENDGYIYEVYPELLEVFNKDKKVLEQRLRVQTSINDN